MMRHLCLVVAGSFTLTGCPADRPASGPAPQVASAARQPAAVLKPERVISGHDDRVLDLTYSRDGTTLASAAEDGTVKVWENPGGRCMHTLQTGSSWVCFSPDGKLLLASSGGQEEVKNGGAVQLWSTDTGRVVRTLRVSAKHVSSADWSPVGGLLAVGGISGRIEVWQTSTWTPVMTLHDQFPSIEAGDSFKISAVRFSPDGKTLVAVNSAIYQGVPGHPAVRVLTWDTATWKQRQKLLDDASQDAVIALSPDSRRLAAATRRITPRGEVLLWDLSSRKKQVLVPEDEATLGAAFVNQGKWLAAGGANGTAILFDTETGDKTALLPHGDKGTTAQVTSMAASPDGNILATGDEHGAIRFWRIPAQAALAADRR